MKYSTILNCRENNTPYKANRKGRKALFLALLLMLFLSLGAKADPVETGRARQVAITFLNNNGSRSIGLTEVSSAAGFSNVYVFTTENSFVLMAADDRIQPILGYSLTSRFDVENMPANKRAWIQGYSDAIQYAIKHQTRASAEVAQQWRDLAEGNPNIDRAATVVAPLIQTQWDQDEPYNNLCPDGTVTGCAATAMAQVMKYWNYPPTGIGMHSYNWNGQTVSADFGSTTYDWNNMLNSYGGSSTEAQRTAVATLMFHCGVSLDMDYGWAWSGGSGAFSSATAGAFINYFNYSSETQLLSRSNYSDTEWINMVKSELNQNRPIWYCGNGSGGGHAFVCDGYNSSNYFHFNWGWSGYCDEYYSINSLSPGPGGIGSGSVGDFSNNQQALFGAQPSPESAAEAPLLTANLITGAGVRNAQLNWNQVDNAVSYNVYRNGTLIHTTSSGSETSYLDVHIAYGTTTYYVRCIDENGILSWPSNYAPVTIIFPAPTNLTAMQVDGGVQLSWSPCEGAVAYNVYCNNGILANDIDQTSFSDNRPIAGELSYFIRGVDSFGDESESSNSVSITIPFSTPVVDDLEAVVSGNTVELSWSAPDWCYPATPSNDLTYGNDNFNGYHGFNNNNTYWGYRYPAEEISAYSQMAFYKVSFYARIGGTYKLHVYEGTNNGHPQTKIREQEVWVESEGWADVVLLENVIINPSHDYWVFFSDVARIDYPATFCSSSSDNGGYYSWSDPIQGVMTNDNLTYLIHTFLTDGVYAYNLYRNGSPIANNINNTCYIDNNLAAGAYNYYLKTNYYAGESSASNQVTAQIGSGNYITITATANPTEGGTVTGAGSYLQGNSCSLTATPNAGYTFSNWTENGEEVSTEATYSFTVTGERSLVANFMENDVCAITFDLYDSYGDGWNGNILVVTDNHGNSYQLTFDDGSSSTQILTLINGSHVELTWISGSWTGECSFTISYENGNVIYYGSNMNGGFSWGFDVDCFEMPAATVEITATASQAEGGSVSGAGSYAIGSTCTLTASANTGYVFMYWTENGEVVSTEATYIFTVTEDRILLANFDNANGTGELSGLFSVSENTQVSFSKGNLLYQASTNTWRFAANQYDYMGSSNSNISADYSGWIDLYCWGTSGWNSGAEEYQPYSTSTDNASYLTGGSGSISMIDDYADADWAYHNTIANGGQQAGLWRCLTHEEYIYLFETRDNASQKYAYGKVNGINGIIILPDAWTLPDGLSFIPQSGNHNDNSYNIEQWALMETAGAVFLPSTGSRQGDYVFYVGSLGDYWSSTAAGEEVGHSMSFFNGNVYPGDVRYRFLGTSVRPVKALPSYTIQTSVNPAEGGTITGTGTYPEGSLCTLTATPNEGYTFVNWTENGIQVSDTPIYSFTVTSNRTLIANFSDVQTTTFSQGYNWWATYIEQEGIDGLGMLQDGLGSNGVTIRSQASGYTDYYSEYGWYGSLTSINNESSYRVITSAPCSVTMTGNVAVPSQHPITLGQGWTWIGYVPSTAMDVNVAMAGLTPTYGDKLKSQQGYSDYYGEDYGWFGSLNTIEPGMGLMYYSTNGEAVTFTYPDGNKGGELKKNLTSENNHWKPNTHAYPDNMTVMAVVEIDDVELTSDNYELAAFAANGECRGSVKLTYAEPINRHLAFLTISGKDTAELSFRLYDTETNMEYYDTKESLNFVANAIVGEADDLYTIHFRSTTGMDELAKSVQVYPNPVNAGERFSINITNDEKSTVRAEIVNALGVMIEAVCSPSLQTITAPNISGVYTLRITVEDKKTIIRKLVVK
jgi:hypothetical protein